MLISVAVTRLNSASSSGREIPLRDHYDWVVVGDHPAALLSGALAARLGLAVLIIPTSSGVGKILSQDGQCLDPEPNYLLGLETEGIHQGLLGGCLLRLGILPSEIQLIQRRGVLPQVATPSIRLRLPTEEEALRTELARELGEEGMKALGLVAAMRAFGGEYVQFWGDLPERFTIQSSNSGIEKEKKLPFPGSLVQLRAKIAKKHLKRRDTSSSFQAWTHPETRFAQIRGQSSSSLEWNRVPEALSALWYCSALSFNEDPALCDLLQILALTRTGASFQGGLTAYRDLLLRIAKRHGAHVPVHSVCQRIFINQGKMAGVQLTHRGNMISAPAGALGCGLERMVELVTDSGSRWAQPSKLGVTPSGWRFTISLEVRKEAVPQGIERRLVWKEASSPVLEIEVVNPEEYGLRSPDRSLIFLRCVLPFTQESLGVEYLRKTAARMLRRASELFPYLEEHVIRIFPDFRKTLPSEKENELIQKIYHFAVPSLIPQNLRVYSSPGVGSRSGIEGLFVTSDESFPELGSLGGTVAALEAVAWLSHRSGLPGPLS